MRYIRVAYMCPECNQIYFFDKASKFSTKCPNCNIDMICVEEKCTTTEEEERREMIRNSSIVSSPMVKCPYCNSINTKKISGLSKAGSVAMFGVFAVGKVSKQWHCNNCKSDF